MAKVTSGSKAWAGLAAYIVSYDIYAISRKKDTLSMAFYEALKHPVKRWPVILIWTYITVHLFKFLPDKFDPLRMFGAMQELAEIRSDELLELEEI